MINGNILIINDNLEESAHLEKLCSKIGTVYTSSNFERAGALLKSKNFNVLVEDYSLASCSSINALIEKPISVVVTGAEEERVKEIVNEWPLSRYVDYHITLSGEKNDRAFLRVLKKAAEHSLMKMEAEDLKSYLEQTNVMIQDTYSDIKKIEKVINESIVRELEKRIELRERHIRFKKEKQGIEEILKNIYIANDFISLLDIVYDIKDILSANGISMYILDEDEPLGRHLKPLIWDDVFLLHPDISKHIVSIDSQDFAAFAAHHHQEINIKDLSVDQRMSKRYLEHFKPPLKSMLCLPIMHDQEVIGVLEVYNKIHPKGSSQEGFSKEDQQIMRTLSEHMSLAITKLNLIQYDALTGLLRPDPFFKGIIHKLKSQRKRHNERESYAMVMGDVDWFKNYNDRNGHEAGNKLLRELAKVLKSSTRDQDLLCRYGGEEFLFFLTDLKNLEEACVFTERIKKDVEEHYFEFQEFQPRNNLTMSFGIAYSTMDRVDSHESITQGDLKKIANEADMALAKAKGKKLSALGTQGKKDSTSDKNKVCVYYEKPTDKPEKEDIIRPYKKKLAKERRKSERFYASNTLLYKEDGAHNVAQTINLSLVGAKISSESKLSPDKPLDLIIILKNKACHFKGDVVYSERVGDDFSLYYSGLKFLDFSPENKTILEDYFSTLSLSEKSSLTHKKLLNLLYP
jgi:diguanylate cyclase (GGDEF)-like protein